jgi:hypothetical protein
MTMTTTKTCLQRLGLLLAVLGAAGAIHDRADASDTKVISNAVCTPTFIHRDNTEFYEFTGQGLFKGGDNDGVIENDEVVCTLERDNPNSTAGLATVEIRVTDPNGTMNCTVFSHDRFDGIFAMPSRGTAAGMGNAIQVLSFKQTDPDQGVFASVAKGYYEIHCIAMHAGATIHSIFYDEL